MRPTTKLALAAVAAAAVALAIVAVPVLLRGSDEVEPPAATPAPGIAAKAGEITTAPQVAAVYRTSATGGIGRALEGLYRLAFVPPEATPGPDASPAPGPAVRVRPSLTAIARSALAAEPAVFDEAADLDVYSATITFSGVITFDGSEPLEALLDIDFSGEATPVGTSSPRVKVRQLGTLVMKLVGDRWFVDGYDLRFATRPLATPTPR